MRGSTTAGGAPAAPATGDQPRDDEAREPAEERDDEDEIEQRPAAVAPGRLPDEDDPEEGGDPARAQPERPGPPVERHPLRSSHGQYTRAGRPWDAGRTRARPP